MEKRLTEWIMRDPEKVANIVEELSLMYSDFEDLDDLDAADFKDEASNFKDFIMQARQIMPPFDEDGEYVMP